MSGTTGLTGSADATFVLEKEKRASDTAKLYVTGRDTPYQEYTLRFRDCRWELVERKTQEQLAKETIPDVLFRLVDFMRDKEEWIGTARPPSVNNRVNDEKNFFEGNNKKSNSYKELAMLLLCFVMLITAYGGIRMIKR